MTDIPESDDLRGRLAEAQLFPPDAIAGARFERLGGLTNRNYRVNMEGERLVLRIAGEGSDTYIDRAVERHNAEVAARAGVGAELLWFDSGGGTMITRFVDGSITMDGEKFRDLGAVARAGRAFRRMHDWREPFRSHFDLFAKMDEYLALLQALNAPIPDGYGEVQKEAGIVRQRLTERPPPLAPSHCDPLAENFLDTGERMVIVDWEYSGMNDPMWDLGDLSVEAGFGPEQDEALLSAYFDGRAVPRAVRGRMVLYKAMCDLLWTLWGVIQVANRNPVDDFWAYAVNRFERCRRLMGTTDYASALDWVKRG